MSSQSISRSETPRSDARPSGRPRLSVAFVLLPHFTLTAFSALVDMLRLSADEGDRSQPRRCNWTILGPTLDPVPASCGIEIAPWQTFGQTFGQISDDPGRFDYIVVVGGLLHRGPTANAATLDFLREAHGRGVKLAGICTGSFALAKAGLLVGRRCCVSWYHYPDLIELTEGVIPVADQLFVEDGGIITCAGGTAALDLGAFLVERHLGPAVAQKSLHILVADSARAATTAQPQPPSIGSVEDAQVRRAMLLIEQNLATPLRSEEIARSVGLSRRHLERRFRSAAGLTIGDFSRRLRAYYALWLMANSEKSIAAIAQESGFADSSHLNRSCRAAFGAAPSILRSLGPETLRRLLQQERNGAERSDPERQGVFLDRERRPYLV